MLCGAEALCFLRKMLLLRDFKEVLILLIELAAFITKICILKKIMIFAIPIVQILEFWSTNTSESITEKYVCWFAIN